MIGILISANVQNLCLNDCISSSSGFPVLWFSTDSEGTAPSTEAHFRMIPSIEFSDFPFAQLVEFPLDLQALVEVMLKLIIWSFQNQIPCHFA